ncbi:MULTISPECIES: DNA polymerase I [Paraclostridium]|uniref:DNA polymerase I n=1 Tax=Paraclostridium bifermentans TaxID=1490 RepID=A0A5P3XCL0_PARBF|nr:MULTISPECIES: DNA polymerase I [Paraclostridium]MBZ6005208.1 DNA polymerase I [Paraclostridium bifermentans]MCR1875370.1 DNA polymerase I [Paraclostridium bifermentans]MDU0296752.1 DNA polymerase I [Paraclostridium sp. MRS3W1]QEZ68727.1 DNA polymerase I [Paraclostridium bifermentans]
MEKTLIIIDGNSIVNRAFYALPDLTNKKGLHTHAIFGFTNMLFKLIDTYKPTHISVAFDKKAPTFRHLEYKEYKAGRKKMPDELKQQLEPLKNLLDAFNINRLEIEGYEADDIIGTVSLKAEQDGYKVYIVTGDKDAIQLASKTTTTLITKKGVGEVEEYDFNKVEEKYGMTPTQFIDLKGLMGDKSDNIPGVPGIGEVTGIKLIKEFGSIENIIENIDSVKGSPRKKIEENKELAIMSKRLATIIRDVPIDFDLEKLEFGNYDKSKLIEVFNELDFNSLIARLDSNAEELKVIVNKLEDVKEFIKKARSSKKIILKTISRTGNILEKNIMQIYLSVDGEELFWADESQIDEIKELLVDEDLRVYGYNLKEDYIALRPYGISLSNIYFDIAIAEYLIDSSSSNYTYDSIAMNYFGQKIKSSEELLGKGVKAKKYEDLEKEELDNTIGSIVQLVEKVAPKMEEKLVNMDMDGLFYHVEMPLVEVLGYMEYEGVMVDKDKLIELGEEFKISIDKLEKDIYNLAGEEFNINSPKQLGVILFEKLELPVIKKTKTGYSTNAEVLEHLSDKHEIIDKITEYRQIVKLKSTYVDGLINIINPISHRIHSSFNQTITTTGRISSTDPNLQNIPVRLELGRNIRKVFIADKGFKLVDADYSQIELRVLAHMSQDEHMIDAFNHNVDIHTKTASQVFGIDINDVTSEQRSAAKAVNFGIVYGISDFGLAKNLHIPVKEAKNYIDSYLNTYEDIKSYMDSTIEEAKEDGYVKTILNRRRYIPEIKSSNTILKNLGKRLAMNAPIQGSAADIIKIAMVNVYKKLEERDLKSKLVLQVHDELIIECIEEELEEVSKIVKDEMEHAVSMDVNLDVDLNTGDSWYETK